MKKYIVQPLVGFNHAKFGMSREEIRGILGSPLREFRKTKFSKTLTDDYGDYHIFYNHRDQFEAVEFFNNAEIWDNKSNCFPDSVALIDKLPYLFSYEDGCYINNDNSIGIYAPEDKIESILFGEKNYF